MPGLQHIVFVTGNYPSFVYPDRGTFVRQLVDSVAEQGLRCTVIHPLKFHEWFRECRSRGGDDRYRIEGVPVYRPLTVSLSNRQFGPWNTFTLTHAQFQRAVWRVLQGMPERPDAVYGHFIYSAGATAVWAAQRLSRPSFVAVGESFDVGNKGLWTLRHIASVASKHLVKGATGFVTVSNLLRKQLMIELDIIEGKIGVFPNGVDRRRFRPLNQADMRRKHSLPQDHFLVAFVGGFDERKGVQRVSKALEGQSRVGGIFMGDGPFRPYGNHVLFSGSVEHQLVPELLCAADVFVLPSRAEGCSNATLEAMACGLPIVVAARPFNRDICGTDCALFVEPNDVSAIRHAIRMLHDAPDLRQKLAEGAMSRAAGFDIRERAHRMLRWMEGRIAEARIFKNACHNSKL